MNELQVFENSAFGSVRTIEEDGKILFCGSDVAKALGYVEPHKAVARHTKGGTKHPVGVVTGQKSNGSDAVQQIEMSFITEGDLYRLIANSKLPSAEQFESWVFDEVLPTIRKHGAYVEPATMDNWLDDPDKMIKALEALKVERQLKAALEAEKKVLVAEINYKDEVITGLVEDIDAYTMRTVINRVVKRGGSPAERYRELYKVFRETNHVDLQARADGYNKKQDKKKDHLNGIGYAEKFGHINSLYSTVVKLYETDVELILAEIRDKR